MVTSTKVSIVKDFFMDKVILNLNQENTNGTINQHMKETFTKVIFMEKEFGIQDKVTFMKETMLMVLNMDLVLINGKTESFTVVGFKMD